MTALQEGQAQLSARGLEEGESKEVAVGNFGLRELVLVGCCGLCYERRETGSGMNSLWIFHDSTLPAAPQRLHEPDRLSPDPPLRVSNF